MKTLATKIALTAGLLLASLSTAYAASIDYFESGPVFTDSAVLIGGTGETDTFSFTVLTGGTYHFYSTGGVDLFGVLYSNTYSTTLAQNDDGASGLNFCVERDLVSGENVTLSVFGYSASNTGTGSYSITGAAGYCSNSGYSYTYNSIPASSAPVQAEEISALALPMILLAAFGLAAVRLRRFFA